MEVQNLRQQVEESYDELDRLRRSGARGFGRGSKTEDVPSFSTALVAHSGVSPRFRAGYEPSDGEFAKVSRPLEPFSSSAYPRDDADTYDGETSQTEQEKEDMMSMLDSAVSLERAVANAEMLQQSTFVLRCCLVDKCIHFCACLSDTDPNR